MFIWFVVVKLLSTPENIGDFLFNQEQYRKAQKVYEMSYKETPKLSTKSKIKMCKSIIQYEGKKETYRNAYDTYKSGNKDSAEKIFEQFQYNYSLGVIAYEKGEYEKAIKYFENDTSAEFPAGVCKYNLGDYEGALNEFIKTEDGMAKLFAGECNYQLERFWEAEKYYNSVMDDNELKEDATYGAGWSCFAQNKYKEAGEWFQKFIEIASEDSLKLKAMYYAGKAFYYAGDIAEAKNYFTKALFTYPENEYGEDIHYWLGKTYYLSKDYANARSEMWLLQKWYPENKYKYSAYFAIGDAYFAEENYELASQWYEKVGSSESSLQDSARFKTEECKYKSGVYKSYTELLAGFIEKYPESPKAPVYGLEIADYWRQNQESKEAIKWYKIVSEKYSGQEIANKAKFTLAEYYTEMKDYPNALSSYGELLNTKIAAKALLGIVNIYYITEDYNKAITEYKNLIKKYPKSISAKESQYRIGELYEKLSKRDEAIMAFTEFLKQYPNDSRYWNTKLKIAKNYMEEGKTDSAYSYFSEVEIHGKGDELYEASFSIGDLYFENSDYQTAKIYYLKAGSGYKNVDKKALALIQAAKCDLSLNNLKSAGELYNEVLTIEPNPVLEQEAKEGVERIKKTEETNYGKDNTNIH